MGDKKTGNIVAAYSGMVPTLQHLARLKGYALAVHGSMQRDLDLIAVPWVDWACSAEELATAIRDEVKGRFQRFSNVANPSHRPHGRTAWAIYFKPGADGPYIDLSVTPRSPRPTPQQGDEA